MLFASALLPVVTSLAVSTSSGFVDADASSTLDGPWEAIRVLDGDATTAWCEGAPEDGVGEVLRLRSPVTDVRAIFVRVGDQKTQADFEESGTPAILEIVVKMGETNGSTLRTALERKREFQPILVDAAAGSVVELRILAAHPGSKGKKTCIADVVASATAPAARPTVVAELPPIPGQHVRIQEHPRDIAEGKLGASLPKDLVDLAAAVNDGAAFTSACVGESPRAMRVEPPAEPDMAPMLFDAFGLDSARFFRRDRVKLEPATATDERPALAPAGAGSPARLLVDTVDAKVCYLWDASGRLRGAVEASSDGSSHTVLDLHAEQPLLDAVDRYKASSNDLGTSWSRTTFHFSVKRVRVRRR